MSPCQEPSALRRVTLTTEGQRAVKYGGELLALAEKAKVAVRRGAGQIQYRYGYSIVVELPALV